MCKFQFHFHLFRYSPLGWYNLQVSSGYCKIFHEPRTYIWTNTSGVYWSWGGGKCCLLTGIRFRLCGFNILSNLRCSLLVFNIRFRNVRFVISSSEEESTGQLQLIKLLHFKHSINAKQKLPLWIGQFSQSWTLILLVLRSTIKPLLTMAWPSVGSYSTYLLGQQKLTFINRAIKLYRNPQLSDNLNEPHCIQIPLFGPEESDERRTQRYSTMHCCCLLPKPNWSCTLF